MMRACREISNLDALPAFVQQALLPCMHIIPDECCSREFIVKLSILHGHMHWKMCAREGVCSNLPGRQAEVLVLQRCMVCPRAHLGLLRRPINPPFFSVQLKLREALLPEVVSQVDHLEGQGSSNGSRPQANSNGKKGKGKGKSSESSNGAPLRTWAANPKLFPCEVAPEAQQLVKEV